MRYCPELSVAAERAFSISAGLDASTTTPGSTAPEVSRTAPVIDPCADARTGMSQAAKAISARRHSIRMENAPFEPAGRGRYMREPKLFEISVVVRAVVSLCVMTCQLPTCGARRRSLQWRA